MTPKDIVEAIRLASRSLGRVISWAVLLLILVQFALVIASSGFGLNSLLAQESLLYLNSLIFLGCAGYTLSMDEHVRVDIFYRSRGKKFQAKVNFWGTLFLLLPVIGLLFLAGGPYVYESWRISEGSTEVSGLQAVFILKSFIMVFAITLFFEAVATILEAVDRIAGDTE